MGVDCPPYAGSPPPLYAPPAGRDGFDGACSVLRTARRVFARERFIRDARGGVLPDERVVLPAASFDGDGSSGTSAELGSAR